MENKNLNNMLKELENIVFNNKKRVFVLFDADNTLFDNDSGIVFSKHSNFDFSEVKKIFKSYDDYCFSAFYEVATLYSNIPNDIFLNAVIKTANEIQIDKRFLHLIREIEDKVCVIIVTAGFKDIWSKIIVSNKLNINLIAGNNIKTDSYIVDVKLKGEVAKYLKEKEKYVISFGDSFVDKEMLINSDRSYLVIYNKIRNDLIELLLNKGKSKLLFMNEVGISEKLKSDMTDFAEIYNFIKEQI